MQTKGILISGAIALVATAAVAATTLSISLAAGSQDMKPGAASGMFGGGHVGWRHGRRGGRGMAHLCGAVRGEKIEHAISFVDNFMSFTMPQQQAWDDLAQTLRAGDKRVGVACAAIKDGKPPKGAMAKLAMAESFLTTGLEVVQKVRPAFDRFHGTLNDKQRKALDDFLSRRHRAA